MDLPDCPACVIDSSDRYVAVSPGWAQVYSPAEVTDWWLGRSHIDAFRLTQHTDWHDAYQRTKSGETIMRTEYIDLPGAGPVLSTWVLVPMSGGGVAIFVASVTDLARSLSGASGGV